MTQKMDAPTSEIWTTNKEKEMVLLWSDKPCSFDLTLPVYRDRVVKDAALKDIAEQLQMTGNSFTRNSMFNVKITLKTTIRNNQFLVSARETKITMCQWVYIWIEMF